jgi:hypothetical protein
MSSTPSGHAFKEHAFGSIPSLLSTLVAASSDLLPTESEIDRLRKEVDDLHGVTRKQANRYQRDLETLVSRHGTADQARRRDAHRSAAATADDGRGSAISSHLTQLVL